MSDAYGEPVASALEYVEPARSYVSVAYTGLALGLGFVLDVVLGGIGTAVGHLPGWLLFGGVIVGAHLLFVYAARATHSLTLSADELRIGDEWLPRADIVGLGSDDEPELQVLGWPNGRPRYIRNIVVRLADDQQVFVPTRRPQLLTHALGVAVVDAPRGPDPVRPAGAADLAELAEIDRRSDTVFRVAGYDLPDIDFDTGAAQDAAAVFVIGDPPVGFVQVDEVDGLAHVHALAVLPGSMRQGVGSRLLERAVEWAAEAGYPAVTLITFAEVRWNAPFYVARGFREDEPDGSGIAALRTAERAHGLDGVGRRIVMRRDLVPATPDGSPAT